MDKLQTSLKAWLTYERGIRSVHLPCQMRFSHFPSFPRLVHPDRVAIQELIQYLLRHHQYVSFEEFYMGTTASFYVEESNSLAEKLKDNPKQFFKHMENCIESEVERAKSVLPVSAWNTVRKFAETAAWKDRTEWLAKTSELTYPCIARVLNTNLPVALPAYMTERNFGPISRMYALFSRIGGTKALITALRDHLQVSLVISITSSYDSYANSSLSLSS